MMEIKLTSAPGQLYGTQTQLRIICGALACWIFWDSVGGHLVTKRHLHLLEWREQAVPSSPSSRPRAESAANGKLLVRPLGRPTGYPVPSPVQGLC